MLKIVDVHASANVQGEYVVLENQGLVTVSLRGWALCTDAYLTGDKMRLAEEMYVFRDDIMVKPYTRVVLFTGQGEDGWVPTIDGKQAFCAYWERREGIWNNAANINVLHILTTKRVAPPEITTAMPLSA